MRGHRTRASREVDAQDGGQQFRAQAHGQGDREQQRLDQRPAEQQVDRQHEQHHHGHRAREQVAEVADASIELRFGWPQRQAVGDGAELGRPSRVDDEATRSAAAHVGAEIETVVASGERCVLRYRSRALAHREAFARQDRLVDVAVGGLEEQYVGGNDAAGRDQHDVSRNDLGDRHRPRLTVAQCDCLHPHPRAQLFRGSLRAVFPCVADADAGDDDRQHDDGVRPFAGDDRHCGSEQQQQQQRAAQLVPEHAKAREAFALSLDFVRTGLRESTLGLRARQAVGRSRAPAQRRRPAPSPSTRVCLRISRHCHARRSRDSPSRPPDQHARIHGRRPDPPPSRQTASRRLTDCGRPQPSTGRGSGMLGSGIPAGMRTP